MSEDPENKSLNTSWDHAPAAIRMRLTGSSVSSEEMVDPMVTLAISSRTSFVKERAVAGKWT